MRQLKDGTHDVEVVTANLGQNKNGKPRIRLGFRDSNGDVATRDLYVTEKALAFTEEILADCFALTGVTDDDFETRLPGIIGRACRIRVAEVNVGTMYQKYDVVAVWPAREATEPGAEGAGPSPDEVRKRFAEEARRARAILDARKAANADPDDLTMVEES